MCVESKEPCDAVLVEVQPEAELSYVARAHAWREGGGTEEGEARRDFRVARQEELQKRVIGGHAWEERDDIIRGKIPHDPWCP